MTFHVWAPRASERALQEAQVAWCINNCFNRVLLARLVRVPERNASIEEALARYPLVRAAFMSQSSYV